MAKWAIRETKDHTGEKASSQKETLGMVKERGALIKQLTYFFESQGSSMQEGTRQP